MAGQWTGHLLDSPPFARRWQAGDFLWSHTGRPRHHQELPSGPAAGLPTGVGLGRGGRERNKDSGESRAESEGAGERSPCLDFA